MTERIDNYPGFPDGIGGADLADRFVAQARRYGVELLSAVEVAAVRARRAGPAGRRSAPARCSARTRCCSHRGRRTAGSGVPGRGRADRRRRALLRHLRRTVLPGRRRSCWSIGGGNSALEEALFLAQFADTGPDRGPRRADRRRGCCRTRWRSHPKFTVHTHTDVLSLRRPGRAADRGGGATRDATTQELLAAGRRRSSSSASTPTPAGSGDTVRSCDQWGFVSTDVRFRHLVAAASSRAGDARAGSTEAAGRGGRRRHRGSDRNPGLPAERSDLRVLEINN